MRSPFAGRGPRDVERALGLAPPYVVVGGGRAAAVLVGLFERAGEPYVWLLRRPEDLPTHAGQVGLPGGKHDPADVDLTATALREAEEEIGLSPRAVEVLGIADQTRTGGSGFVVTPVVGWVAPDFEPSPNPREVARTFAAPLSLFREPAFHRILPFERARRALRRVRYDGELVWGATATILASVAGRMDRL